MKQQANTQWIGDALMKKPHSKMTFSNKQALYKVAWDVILPLLTILDKFIFVHFIVDNMKFTKEWAKIFQEMNKTKTKQLRINDNNDPLIIKNLMKITFTHLKHIDISSNKIVSLELFSFVSFKSISEIKINKNCIRNLKPLRKMILDNEDLSYIDVSENCITSYQDLCHINSFGLGKIVINWYNQQVYCPNVLGQLLKLPLLGLRAMPRQQKRFQKLLYPEHLIMKKYWTPEIGRQNQNIRAKNSKYIRIQSRSQIINTKAQRIIMRKFGNEENEGKNAFERSQNRGESGVILKIFNAQQKEIIF